MDKTPKNAPLTPEMGAGTHLTAKGNEGALRGRCGGPAGCQHVWVIASLPMPLEQAARLAEKASCPMCGGSKVYASTATPTVIADHQPVGGIRHG